MHAPVFFAIFLVPENQASPDPFEVRAPQHAASRVHHEGRLATRPLYRASAAGWAWWRRCREANAHSAAAAFFFMARLFITAFMAAFLAIFITAFMAAFFVAAFIAGSFFIAAFFIGAIAGLREKAGATPEGGLHG